MNVVNILPITSDEKITSMIRVPNFSDEDNFYLCMLTKQGIIKRTPLNAYKNIRKSGILAINLDEGDELDWVALTDGTKKIMVATKKGFAITFEENDARVIGRTARGVKAISLRDGDEDRPNDPAYANSYFFNCGSDKRPRAYDRALQEILDPDELYSGCYGKVNVNFYAYDRNGNRGIGAGLNMVQKLEDGEPLGGSFVSAQEAFGDDCLD